MTSGCYAYTLLMVSAFTNVQRSTVTAGATLAVIVLGLIADRIFRFDKMVPIKNISSFQEVATALPKDATVVLKISDALRFEWAAYYLRDHKTVPVVGRLAYFASPPAESPAVQQRISEARYLVTDTVVSGDRAVWSNGFLHAYRIAPVPAQPT